MIPRNRKNIRRRAFHFWGLFVILLVFTMLPACCFIWTARDKSNEYITKGVHSKELQHNGREIYSKMSSIFNTINSISSIHIPIYEPQVEHVTDLEAKIDQLMSTESKGLADTIRLFTGYAHINRNLSKLLSIKIANLKAADYLKKLQASSRAAEGAVQDRYR